MKNLIVVGDRGRGGGIGGAGGGRGAERRQAPDQADGNAAKLGGRQIRVENKIRGDRSCAACHAPLICQRPHTGFDRVTRGAAAGDVRRQGRSVMPDAGIGAQVIKQHITVHDVVYDPGRMEFLRFSRNAIANIMHVGVIIIMVKNEVFCEMKISTFGFSTP